MNELENTLGLEAETADSDAVKIVVHTSEKTVNKLAEHILKG